MAAGQGRQLDTAPGSRRISYELWLWAKAQILALHPPLDMGTNAYAAARSGTTAQGAEAQLASSPWVPNPTKVSRNQQQLHRELLFTHRKGLNLRSKPELLQVLEYRNRRRDGTESGVELTPLERELQRWQQRREQNEQQEATGDITSNQPEFMRVRENLRRTYHSRDLSPQRPTPSQIPNPLLRLPHPTRQPSKVPVTLSRAPLQAQIPQLQGSLGSSSLSSSPSQCPLDNT